jgi:hypothetical protein
MDDDGTFDLEILQAVPEAARDTGRRRVLHLEGDA